MDRLIRQVVVVRRVGVAARLVIGLAIGAILFSGGAAAQEPTSQPTSRISFLDDRAIEIAATGGQPLVASVVVINQASTSQDVSLFLTTSDTAQPPTMVAVSTPISAGLMHQFTVPLEAKAYEGVLIAVSNLGGYATRDLKVTAAPSVDTPAPDRLGPPLPKKVSMTRDKWVPTPLTPLLDLLGTSRAGSETSLAAWADAGWQWSQFSAVESTRTTLDGVALGAANTIARLNVGQDGVLNVTGATRAGTYDGTAKFGSGDTASTVDISMQVRDFFLWPFLLLLLGLLAVSKLDAFLTRRRPRALLRLQLARIKEAASDEQKRFVDWLASEQAPAWPGDNRTGIILYAGENQPSLLRSLSDKAVAEFDQVESDEERSKLFGVPYGSQVVALGEYVERLTVINDVAAREVSSDYRALLGRLEPDEDPSQLPIVANVRAAWSGKQPERSEEFDEREKAIQETSELLKRLAKVLDIAKRVQAMAQSAGGDFPAKARTIRSSLLGATTETSDDLDGIKDKLVVLEVEIAASGEPRRHGLAEALGGDLPLDEDALMRLRDRLAARRQPERSVELAEELAKQESRYNKLAAAFVILSGLAVYLGNATFGSLADYLGIFLWATVVGEGIKLARRVSLGGLVDRLAS